MQYVEVEGDTKIQIEKNHTMIIYVYMYMYEYKKVGDGEEAAMFLLSGLLEEKSRRRTDVA